MKLSVAIILPIVDKPGTLGGQAEVEETEGGDREKLTRSIAIDRFASVFVVRFASLWGFRRYREIEK